MNRDSKRPVTLEDLLQLKRAERPPAEFWTHFERDLRAKQLAALVEKRPWWRSMPKLFAGFSRYHLPIGATAVVALSLVAISGYQKASPVAPSGSGRSASAAAMADAAAPAALKVSAESAMGSSAAPTAMREDRTVAAISETPAGGSTDPVLPVVAMLGSQSDFDTPSARAIASNRAVAQALDPELSNRFLASAHGFETRALPARQPAVEPLAQMSVSDSRRSRLIATAVPAAFTTTSTASSEKIARRISDERLYDTVTRFGARGDRLNVKF